MLPRVSIIFGPIFQNYVNCFDLFFYFLVQFFNAAPTVDSTVTAPAVVTAVVVVVVFAADAKASEFVAYKIIGVVSTAKCTPPAIIKLPIKLPITELFFEYS